MQNPDVSSLATKAALTAVENNIPDVSSLVKKTSYNTKITEIEKKLTDHNHDKYITTPEFDTLAADVRLKQTKILLVDNELNNVKTFDSSYFIVKSRFEEDGTENYLVFQPINNYFKVIPNTDYISSWKSKGSSAETIKPPTTSDNSLTPAVSYYGTKSRVKFTGSCLEQSKVTYTRGKVVNIFIGLLVLIFLILC